MMKGLAGLPWFEWMRGKPMAESPGTVVAVPAGTSAVADTGSDAYVDRSRVVLADLLRQHADASSLLRTYRTHFASLHQKADAASVLEALQLAAKVVEQERIVSRLAPQIGQAQRAVVDHEQLYADYRAQVEAVDAALAPVLAWLDALDEKIRWATEWSRALDHAAAMLLSATSDRQFRRASTDPLRAIRESLEARLQYLQRYRIRHTSERHVVVPEGE
jgi:hypothetical protein